MTVVETLQELIRFDTTNPPGNEGNAAEAVEARLGAAGIKTQILESPGGRPSVIGTLEGDPNKPALVLLSHLDVVGVEPDRWTHDPFGGEIHDGYVWGRGALDMKGIAAMHIAAALELASGDRAPERSVVVAAVADEEAGGSEGARWLVDEHPEVFGFDERRPPPEVIGEGAFGLSGILERPLMPVSLGEKSALWLKLEATGDPGHGAMPPKSQAPLNLARAVRAVSGYHNPHVHPVMRAQFRATKGAAPRQLAVALSVLASSAAVVALRAGRIALPGLGRIGNLLADTVVVSKLDAGYKTNVVPGTATAELDCRLLPDTDLDHFRRYIELKVAKHSVKVSELQRNGGPVSSIGPAYRTIESVSTGLAGRPVVTPSLTPGITDIRFLRAKGATGYGWVPLVIDAELLATVHGHDERVSVEGLETAARAMGEVVRRVALGD